MDPQGTVSARRVHLDLDIVFGRKKQTERPAQPEAARPHREGAKNRPTPKRKDQEAARRRPLVATDVKKRKSADRAARRQEAAKMRAAMVTGDDRHLPPRDKGPVRRFVRDCVDARFSVGEILLPLMLSVLVLSLLTPRLATLVFLAVYVMAFLAVLDSVLLWRRTKQKLLAKFGAETDLKGLPMYTVMRSFQMRRTRMPRPQVDRGTRIS